MELEGAVTLCARLDLLPLLLKKKKRDNKGLNRDIDNIDRNFVAVSCLYIHTHIHIDKRYNAIVYKRFVN